VKAGAPKDATAAAQQLEAYFLRRVLSEVKTSGGMAKGVGADTFQDMFNEALADKMSEAGGVGLSKQIAEQLEAGHGAAPRPPAPGLDNTLPGRGSRGASSVSALSLHREPTAAIALPQRDASAGIPLTSAPRGAAVYAQVSAQARSAADGKQGIEALVVRPVPGRVTSRMGDRFDPIDGHHSHHAGIDLAARTGTPVVAAGAGKVVRAGEASGYGNLVVVDHGNGTQTRYAHLDRVDVKVGDVLDAGQPLGAAGATGRVTGAHLHFEIRQDGEPVDPAAMLRAAIRPPSEP
jgi:murein DD-endopeptidase MepM/ murein hydrolase activator NlpD